MSKRSELFSRAKEMGITIPISYSNEEIEAVLNGDLPPPRKGSRRREKKRVPLGVMRSKLSVSGYDIPEDKVARWVNDKPGRLMAAEEGGYQFVVDPKATVGEEPLDGRDNIDQRVSRHVGPGEDGKPMKAYLMVIDKDLWEEDQEEKQREVDETDRAIRRGSIHGEPGVDGKYVGSETKIVD